MIFYFFFTKKKIEKKNLIKNLSNIFINFIEIFQVRNFFC